MGLHRALASALAALAAAAVNLGLASPSQSAPARCTELGFSDGRHVYAGNGDEGGGAFVSAILCYEADGSGSLDAYVEWGVADTEVNGAGATVRLEWRDAAGATGHHVPPPDQRAWTAWDLAGGEWAKQDVADLRVRACLTGPDEETHHCGPES
jgi:hypothetical protein